MIASEFAPAKVNLFLHVGPARADGRHPVCSLATFADVGDALSASLADVYSLEVDGPFAGDIGPVADNLITRALVAVDARPMAIRLTKNLPAASGLGGGSSDAGAALRLALALQPDLSGEAAAAVARDLGADGLLGFEVRPSLAQGDGEALTPPPAFPALDAVLINPGVPSPTGAVYRAYDEGVAATADLPAMPGRFETADGFIEFLAGCRNDLQAAAVRLEPAIGRVLDWLGQRPEPQLVRMSGSGATCMAICRNRDEAVTLARAAAPIGRWVRTTRLQGFGGRG